MSGDVRLALWVVSAPAVLVWRVGVGLWRLRQDPTAYATGGVISPPSGDPSDRIPARVSPGCPPQGPWKAFGVARPTQATRSQSYAPHGTPDGASQSQRQGAGNGPQLVQDATEAAPDGGGHPWRTVAGYSATQDRPEETQ